MMLIEWSWFVGIVTLVIVPQFWCTMSEHNLNSKPRLNPLNSFKALKLLIWICISSRSSKKQQFLELGCIRFYIPNIWLDDGWKKGKNKLPPVVQFASTYAWAFAIMTLDSSAINVLLYTMPSTSKIIIACTIFDLYPLSYVTKKASTCRIVHYLFGEYLAKVWLSEGCCNWVMNLIITLNSHNLVVSCVGVCNPICNLLSTNAR